MRRSCLLLKIDKRYIKPNNLKNFKLHLNNPLCVATLVIASGSERFKYDIANIGIVI